MSSEFEIYLHQRKLKRKIVFWRIFSMFAVFIFLLTIAIFVTDLGEFEKNSDHIAKISISGIISDEYSITDTVLKLKNNDNVKGVILAVDSPGGSTFASESLYNDLRELSKVKPLVAQIGTYGASGGYLVALAADHIIAQQNSITGSIGVALEIFDTADLLKKVGVSYQSVKSSPLKDEPNYFQQVSQEGLNALEDIVNDTYNWFIGIVAERRLFSLQVAKKLGDGRIYNGNQALELGLIDEIGNAREALIWLNEQGLDETLPIVNWSTPHANTSITISDIFTYSISEFIQKILTNSIGLQSNFHTQNSSFNGLVSILEFTKQNSGNYQ